MNASCIYCTERLAGALVEVGNEQLSRVLRARSDVTKARSPPELLGLLSAMESSELEV